jgi:hypothetical protein
MKTFIVLLALCFCGLCSGLKESASECGGGISIELEDVHFKQFEVDPEDSFCIENNDDVRALVTDSGDSGELQFTVAPHSSLYLEAQPTFEYRVITIDVVPE